MMINCPECGKEVSDKAAQCPNCGYPLQDVQGNPSAEEKKDNKFRFTEPKESDGTYYSEYSNGNNNVSVEPNVQIENDDKFVVNVNGKNYDIMKIWDESSEIDDLRKRIKKQTGCEWKEANAIVREFKNSPKFKKKKDSALSTAACVFALFTCTAPIAMILAIIDLASGDKKKKHTGSIFALIYGVIAMLILFPSMFGNKTGNYNTSIGESEKQTETTTQDQAEEEITTEELTTEEIPQETEEEYRESCEEYNYKDVLRNPEDYVGKRIKVRLGISSVHEESIFNSTKYYFACAQNEYGWYSGDLYGVFDERYDNSLKLLSDDVVEVYGEIAESEYTKSLIVSSEEILCIKMKYVDLIEE